jgi:hypothetical protein
LFIKNFVDVNIADILFSIRIEQLKRNTQTEKELGLKSIIGELIGERINIIFEKQYNQLVSWVDIMINT